MKDLLKDSWTVDLRESEEYCADCEAMSHYVKLQEIKIDLENIFISFEKLKDALCFILENVNWEENHKGK